MLVEKYVRNCAWARDSELKIDGSQILCESYRDKQGSQRFFQGDNPLQLVGGTRFFQKKTKLFDHVVGFAKFSEFLVVAEVGKLVLPAFGYCIDTPFYLVPSIAFIIRIAGVFRWKDLCGGKVPSKHASRDTRIHRS